ncbi:hypothetical protein OSK21_24485, partial [Escherichia coli]|nr:hypothetical protein [Escherichia coli]
SGKNIIRWLLKKRTNGSVRYCQYTSYSVMPVTRSGTRMVAAYQKTVNIINVSTKNQNVVVITLLSVRNCVISA